MKDLWAYLSFLDHTNGLDFDSFQQKYCDVREIAMRLKRRAENPNTVDR